jgi:outer membrane protein assembly factor BamB
MAALNKRTGEVVWKARSSGDKAGYASPILVNCQGLRIIITLTSGAMIGVNADTGELLWRVEHKPYAEENILTPIYQDRHVFASGVVAGSVMWKIHVKDGKASVEEVWRSKDMDNHHGGVLLVDGHLYGSSCVYHKEQWVCLDWKTGEKKYVDRGVGKGSLTFAAGLLYTLSRERVVGLVRPSPKGHELISSFKIPKGGKGPSWAHPVVCGGRMYIRHGNFLYAYGVRAKE